MRRLLQMMPVLFVLTLITFLLVHLVPGDPAVVLAGSYATLEDIELVRTTLGLDRPLTEQYLSYLGKLVRGDFGESLRSHQPVLPLILQRVPSSLFLASISMVLATAIGVLAGVFSAYWKDSLLDSAATVVSLAGLCMPSFWLGLMLMLLFAVKLGWFPTYGTGSLGHVVLPAVTLAAASVATIQRLTRGAVIEVLSEDYIRTEYAKGLSNQRVLAKALRNASLPIVTFIGLQLGVFLSHAVVVERVFSWPGVASLAVEAILQRDLPLVQGLVLLFGVTFLLVNLVVDLSYAYLDPRLAAQMDRTPGAL